LIAEEVRMYTAERQREQPYLDQVVGPLIEQWYLLHHRMVRVVTNHRVVADYVQHFLFYAELMAEYVYERPADLPVNIPEDLLWQAGQRLYYPVALTCYLFEPRPDEAFPPAPAQAKPDDLEWIEIGGLDGLMRARWKEDLLRFREFQAFPGVCSRICSVLHKKDFHATIFIQDVAQCQPWFLTRFVFYMVIGAMFGYSGYEIIHAGAVALHDDGVLLVGSPGSGKSTLILSCLESGMSLLADDVLFLAKDDGLVRVYAFPEDIGVRKGTTKMLAQAEYIQTLPSDMRQKRPVDVQRYFGQQVVSSCPVRVILFLHAEQRAPEFRAESLTRAQAVHLLMQEYISQQQAQEGEADYMFDIFGDLATQAPSYRLWLTPDPRENAERVRQLMLQHSHILP
jgi:hypothetical protein